MKTFVIILAVTCCCWRALAADQNVVSPSKPKPSIPAAEPNRTEPLDRPDAASVRPEKPKVPQTTASLMHDFTQARRAYLAKRSELHKALRTASEEQRQTLREQLKNLRQEQGQAREQLRRQLQELRERLPSHRDLIDNAREREGNRRRRGE